MMKAKILANSLSLKKDSDAGTGRTKKADSPGALKSSLPMKKIAKEEPVDYAKRIQDIVKNNNRWIMSIDQSLSNTGVSVLFPFP